ncbi:hypothetical protein DRE_03736 [Drechslerella stenobrocha 248]|uniref:Uncharacterized protein n=1 Tax=Drechslerella stenobrocha 248 TaxID=1043628 RepID=W7HU55_9PEZI|nr:hypothetical protein DRE_03736 [Drechslerella stenobrocha 248]
MARRAVSNCILAAIAIFLFLSLTPYFDRGVLTNSLRNDGLFHEGASNDDSLNGAIGQTAGKSTPEPYQVADPPLQNSQQPQPPPPPPPPPPSTDQKEQQPQPQHQEQQQEQQQERQQQQQQHQEQQQPAGNTEDKYRQHLNPEEEKKKGQIPTPPPQWTFDVKDDVRFDPAGPRPDQIVMLMASDGKGHNGGIENLLEMARENRRQYAEFQGYNFHFINISRYDLRGAHPVWAKIPALLDTFIHFPDAQWVWWLDLDAIIMNPDIDLASHILSHAAMRTKFEGGVEYLKGGSAHTGHFMTKDADPREIDLIIGQDHNGLNAGSFFLRRSKFTKLLLDWWEEPFYVWNEWPGKEQDALLHMVQHHRHVREHVGLVPQRVLNGFPVGWDNMGWHNDDLVVHLAGCWVDNACNERWKEYWGQRITVADLKAKGITKPTDHTGKVTKILKEGTIYVPLSEEDRGASLTTDAKK